LRTGLIAGYGVLPKIAYDNLLSKGHDVFVVALSEEVTESFSDVPQSDIIRISVTQTGKIIKTLKNNNVKKVLFAGKVNKTIIFSSLKFDLTAVKLLASLRNRKDDTVMDAVCGLMISEGFEIMPQTEALDCLYLPKGVYSRKKPTREQLEDVEFGLMTAKELGRLDIGQTVVVKDKAVMALEAIEGTDKAVIRGCQLAKSGAVIVKCAKPSQDLRYDIPTVGVDTLKNIADNKGGLLAVEADKTFVVDREACVNYADKNNIIFMAI